MKPTPQYATHRQAPLNQQGFSLIEILVGLVIGLLATLVIMQVFSVFEGPEAHHHRERRCANQRQHRDVQHPARAEDGRLWLAAHCFRVTARLHDDEFRRNRAHQHLAGRHYRWRNGGGRQRQHRGSLWHHRFRRCAFDDYRCRPDGRERCHARQQSGLPGWRRRDDYQRRNMQLYQRDDDRGAR